jgi:excisionase family DNA binding protein
MRDTSPLAVSISEAAKMLNLGRTTVYKLLNEKRLPLMKVGSRSLVPVAAIHEFVAELAREAA